MLVIGEKEEHEGAVAVRSRAKGDLGAMPLDAFLSAARQEVADKTIA